MKRWVNKPIFSVLNNHIIDYPTPLNISYFWGFGSLSGLILAIQIITGVFLAIHYTPQVDMAFTSVEHIMRDVNNGWVIRYLHCNGASFFLLLFIRICFVVCIMGLTCTHVNCFGALVF